MRYAADADAIAAETGGTMRYLHCPSPSLTLTLTLALTLTLTLTRTPHLVSASAGRPGLGRRSSAKEEVLSASADLVRVRG